MSLFLTLLRVLLSLVLGVVVFLGLLTFLLFNAIGDHFLQAQSYNQALAENRIYDRVYDELFTDPGFRTETQRLLGDFDVPAADIESLVRQVLPPDYLQSQVEGAINGAMDYLKKDTDQPQVYIDLSQPLTRVKPVLFDYIEKRIDGMKLVPAPTLQDLTRELEVFISTVGAGKFPAQLPSLKAFPAPLRLEAYDQAVQGLRQKGSLDARALTALARQEGAIKAALTANDIQQAAKLASRAVGDPYIDDAIQKVRQQAKLDARDRLDLVTQLAESNNETRQEFLDRFDSARDELDQARTLGLWVPLLVVALGALLLGAVHLPRRRYMLLWPGITLLLSGLVFLVMGLVLKAQLPDRLQTAITEDTSICGDLTQSGCRMITDVLGTLSRDAAASLLTPSAVVMIIGAGLIVLSVVLLIGGHRRSTRQSSP